MIVDPVTTRYANALYNLASRQRALTEVARDVEALSAALADPALRRMIASPRVDREKKRREIEKLLTSVHPLTKNLGKLVTQKRREEVLIGLGDAFRRRTLEERGAADGVVETARPITTQDVQRIAGVLGKRLKKELVLQSRTVPELVGGARVIAANRMIDYSVQGRLEALRRKMLEARLPSSSGR